MSSLKDIATRCGVSVATVSKALNGYGDVAADTSEAILQAAKLLQYKPDHPTRKFRGVSSRTIGFLSLDENFNQMDHTFLLLLFRALKQTADAHNYAVSFPIPFVSGSPSTYLEHVRSRRLDGVIIAGVDHEDPMVQELAESEIPCVAIDLPLKSCSSVLSDNAKGSYELVKYLYKKGHRRIAMIQGSDNPAMRMRNFGFSKAVYDLNLDIPLDYYTRQKFCCPSASALSVRKLLSLSDPPTAILFPDDLSYIGGLMEFTRLGLSVPDDISCVGFGGYRIGFDQSTLASVIQPSLTTWCLNMKAITETAFTELERLMSIERKYRLKSDIQEFRIPGTLYEGGSVMDLTRKVYTVSDSPVKAAPSESVLEESS